MPLYYFDYFYKYEELVFLINYLEKSYGLKYTEVIDLPSIFSFNFFGISFGFTKKKVMFRAKKDMNSIAKCKNCNFPTEKKDLKMFHGTDDLVCKNCNCKPD